MEKFAAWSLVAIIATIAIVETIIRQDSGKYMRIECSTAEFNPDYTQEMRDMCRMLRGKKI